MRLSNNNGEFIAECVCPCLDMIDAAFLRPGRFDKTLYIGLPDSTGRYDILLALSRVITSLSFHYMLQFCSANK